MTQETYLSSDAFWFELVGMGGPQVSRPANGAPFTSPMVSVAPQPPCKSLVRRGWFQPRHPD